MLSVVVVALAFTAPSSVCSRRQALQIGAGVGSLGFGLMPAHAEMYGDGKAGDSRQGALARELKYAKAGEETEEFKKAEAKRIARESGAKAKEETAEEAMKRLGLRTYSDAVAS